MSISKLSGTLANHVTRALLLLIVGAALVLAVGCGGGSSGTPPPPPPPPGNTATQVKLGDAPADRVVAFEFTIASPVVVHPSGGGAAVNVSVGTNRFELSHMAGTFEPLALLNFPQGSYSSVDLTVTNPEVTWLDNAGQQHSLQSTASQTITVTFNPALVIGASPMVVNIDVSVANSLTFDPSGNVIAFNFSGSSFTFSAKPVASGQQEADDGEMEDVVGLVNSVSGTSFTLTMGMSGVQLTFTTDANTVFSDGASLATMANTIVKVEGVTKADGTLYAKEVEGIENNMGMEAEGLITQVTGNPATQLTLIVHDGMGSGMDMSKMGATFTVDVTNAQYKIDQGNVDFSGLQVPGPNFPFDATTIQKGQRVEVESVSGMMGMGAVTAEKVKLEQQAITGTVTALSGTSAPRTITMTVPADSALSILFGGPPTVTVYQQPFTDLHNLTTINVGDTIRVRGLLFWTGASFNLIARRISP